MKDKMPQMRKLLHKIDNQFHQINVIAFCLKDEIKSFKGGNPSSSKGKKLLKRATDVLADIENVSIKSAGLTNSVRQILKKWGKLE